MKLFRGRTFSNILAIYLVYTVIPTFSVYFLGGIAGAAIVLYLLFAGLHARPKVICNNKENKAFVFGWSVVFLLSILIHSAIPGTKLLIFFVFCCFFLFLKKEIQQEVLTKYAWFLSILVLLSAIEYILYITTGRAVILSSVTRTTDYRETYFNHLLFNVIRTDVLFSRFQGLFTEPGNLGTTCGFMLFATWKMKSVKFPFFVFLLCGMLSMSLAYYVYLLVFLITNVKLSGKNLAILTIITFLFIYSFHDIFEAKIYDRINDAENVEELDNRTSEAMERAFWKSCSSGQIIFGVGINNIPESLSSDGGSAGAKKWIYQYGIISLIIVFWIYNLVYYRRCGKNLKYRDWVFLLVYWATFYKSDIFLIPDLFVVYLIMPELNKINKTSVWTTK